jgi:alpha-glucosidase
MIYLFLTHISLVDYMYQRLVFTNDPDYFPLAKMRQIVKDLHARDQHYSMLFLYI